MFDAQEHDRLVSYAGSLVGPQSAEDVVQEYYLHVLSGRVPFFRHESKRLTWLLSIVKFISIRWQQREGRFLRGGHVMAPNLAPDYDDLLDLLVQTEQLTPEQQRVLRFVFDTDEISYQPIADALDLTRDQVRGRLYRARRRLKERMAS